MDLIKNGQIPSSSTKVSKNAQQERKQAPQTKFSQKTETKEPLIQGSIREGVKRTLSKTFTRPRGLLELFLCLKGIGFIFLLKDFVEGFFGVDSIFMKRRFSLRFKEHKGRTLISAIKDKFFPGKANSTQAE